MCPAMASHRYRPQPHLLDRRLCSDLLGPVASMSLELVAITRTSSIPTFLAFPARVEWRTVEECMNAEELILSA